MMAARSVVLRLISIGIALWLGAVFMSTRTSAVDPAEGRHVYIDRPNGTSFAINLDRTSPLLGRFSFAVQSVGTFSSDDPASVAFQADQSVTVSYVGTGFLDPYANVDLLFGLDQMSGTREPAAFSLQGEIDATRATSTVHLVHQGTDYVVTDQPPSDDPSPAVEAILAAIEDQDWSSLYDLAYSPLQASMTRQDFVARMTEGWAGRGVVTEVDITVPPELGSPQAGFDVAESTILFVLTKDGIPSAHLADLSLLWEQDGWRFISIDLRE